MTKEGHHLFVSGRYTLHSGAESNFRINADSLDHYEMRALCDQLKARLPKYGIVVGIPTGGSIVANVMHNARDADSETILIVDDVYTTGGSMESYRRAIQKDGREILGAVLFARNFPPPWITPLFIMHPEINESDPKP